MRIKAGSLKPGDLVIGEIYGINAILKVVKIKVNRVYCQSINPTDDEEICLFYDRFYQLSPEDLAAYIARKMLS